MTSVHTSAAAGLTPADPPTRNVERRLTSTNWLNAGGSVMFFFSSRNRR